MRSVSLREKIYLRNPIRFRNSFFLVVLFFYFSFHLVTGERGLLAFVQLNNQMQEKEHQAKLIKNDKVELAKQVVGLRDNTLNLDLLEEIARKDLGYSKKDEVILLEQDIVKYH